MAKVLPSKVHELLNTIVDGQIEYYEVDYEEVEFQGDNFLGEIMFVSLKNKNSNEKLELVVKQTNESVDAITIFNNVYTVEISFYEEIWPVLNKFQKAASIGFNKIAKYYASDKTAGKEKIVLENIKQQQFQMYEKTKPLDWQHMELIFQSYAIFHAISYAFRELHPEEFSKLKDLANKRSIGLHDVADDSEMIQAGFLHYVKNSMEYITKLFDENDDQEMLNKFKAFTETSDIAFFESTKYTGDTPMLLHGDSWSNNMMFKYNENGDVVDMKFLDFQLVNCGSPVNDLSYAFYSGAPKEVLDRLGELMQLYIKVFTETLEKFNCKPQKPYTLEKLKSEWKQYGKFGLGMGVVLWRTKYANKTKLKRLSEQKTDVSCLIAVAEEYEERLNKQFKDLARHFYENDLF